MFDHNNIIAGTIAGLISTWVFAIFFAHRVENTRARIFGWIASLRMGISRTHMSFGPRYKSYIVDKYKLADPGEVTLNRYVYSGTASATFMPSEPTYMSPSNAQILNDAIRYANAKRAKDPRMLSHVSDFIETVGRLGVFYDQSAADEFIALAKDVLGTLPGNRQHIEQPVWAELDEARRRSVTVPRDAGEEMIDAAAWYFATTRIALLVAIVVLAAILR